MKKRFILLVFISLSINYLSAQYMSAGKDTTVCPGNLVRIGSWADTSQYLYFRWHPDNLVSDPQTISPYAMPDTTTTYYFYAYKPDTINLVVNGDFEDPRKPWGFTSSYTYVNPGGSSLVPEGVYTIHNNASFSHSSFSALRDHTHTTMSPPNNNPSNYNYQIINGSTGRNVVVWSQKVPVQPNTDYVFYTWGASILAQNPAILQFSINGDLLDKPFQLKGGGPSEWQQFYTIWPSGNNTDAVISIVNSCIEVSGNDFGLDDIFFSPVIADIDSVTIYKGPNDTSHVVTALCPQKSYVFNNKHIITESGTYIDTLRNNLGCDSITILEIAFMEPMEVSLGEDQTWCGADTSFIVLNAGEEFHAYRWNTNPDDTLHYIIVEKSGTYSVTVSDSVGCEVTDEVNIIFGTPPNIKITSDTKDFCKEYKMTLSIETEFSDITWNTGETGLSIEATEFGTYSVIVRDEPCYSVDTFNIEFCCPRDAKLPNVITPTVEDGFNDVFKFVLDAPYEKLYIIIYDRWGKQVYKSEDPKFEWGGTVGNKVVPGTYHYMLTLEDGCTFHGTITVL